MIEKPPFPLWSVIRQEVTEMAQSEPLLASFLHMTVLQHNTLEEVLAFHLSSKLSSPVMDARALMELFRTAMVADSTIGAAMQKDIMACMERDPACEYYFVPLLYFKGFHAIQGQRITHWLWRHERRTLALFLQNRISEVTGVDAHPAARIGHGIMLDHGTGVVIGETAVIGNEVSILQGVTLGGTGKESGDRHPKVGNGVLIGANTSILGNITIGDCAKIGAGSVVLQAVPAYTTVVGVPAAVVDRRQGGTPGLDMDHVG